MIKRNKIERNTIGKVLPFFDSVREHTYSKEKGLLNSKGEPVEIHPEDNIIKELLKFFEEFDSYEDIEINYQIEECEKKVMANEGFDENEKKRLKDRLKLVKKQLYHKYNHKEFEYSRGTMIIDDVE